MFLDKLCLRPSLPSSLCFVWEKDSGFFSLRFVGGFCVSDRSLPTVLVGGGGGGSERSLPTVLLPMIKFRN